MTTPVNSLFDLTADSFKIAPIKISSLTKPTALTPVAGNAGIYYPLEVGKVYSFTKGDLEVTGDKGKIFFDVNTGSGASGQNLLLFGFPKGYTHKPNVWSGKGIHINRDRTNKVTDGAWFNAGSGEPGVVFHSTFSTGFIGIPNCPKDFKGEMFVVMGPIDGTEKVSASNYPKYLRSLVYGLADPKPTPTPPLGCCDKVTLAFEKLKKINPWYQVMGATAFLAALSAIVLTL